MLDISTLIDRGAALREIAPGEVIFNEGTPATFYYQLVSGRVRWSNLLDNGKEVLHYIVEPGESFGELPFFDGRNYAASAIADTTGSVIRLRSESFKELLAERPQIQISFNKLFVERLRFSFFLSNMLALHAPEIILENLLAYFQENNKYVCRECNCLLLTRQQLANMTGLRVETVIRTIKHMQHVEKLRIVRGKVFVFPVPASGMSGSDQV